MMETSRELVKPTIRRGMPDEGAVHERTWMAFGAHGGLWGSMLVSVQKQLANIANAIVAFEPVTMLVRPEDMGVARQLCHYDVELVACALDDIWMRDTGPVFIQNEEGRLFAVDFNFNGWGSKQASPQDRHVAAWTAKRAEVDLVKTSLVLEGGGIEVDGHGTAIITESSVLNDNRNPGVSKAAAEAQLMALLGLEKIIWLPGIRGRDITDAHVDFYARFTSPGVVLVHLDTDTKSYVHAMTLRHLEILRSAHDAQGRRLNIVLLPAPTRIRPEFANVSFAAGYLNYYLVNGGLIVPEFGDQIADESAQSTLRKLYPDRRIVAINIDCIAAGGGGIHCVTQQQPKSLNSAKNI